MLLCTENRTKQNCLALARTVLDQMFRTQKPVRIRFAQSQLRMSDHFGWPVPEGTYDGLLAEAFKRTEKVHHIPQGGRLLLNAAGQQMNHGSIMLLQLIRAALVDDQAVQTWMFKVLVPDPIPEYHPITGTLPQATGTEVEEATTSSTEAKIQNLKRELQELDEKNRHLAKKVKVWRNFPLPDAGVNKRVLGSSVLGSALAKSVM